MYAHLKPYQRHLVARANQQTGLRRREWNALCVSVFSGACPASVAQVCWKQAGGEGDNMRVWYVNVMDVWRV